MTGAKQATVFFGMQLIVSPVLLLFRICSAVAGADETLRTFSQWLSLVPGLFGCYVRAAFFHWTLDSFHPTARVDFGVLLSRTAARIGANVYVGPYSSLGLVTIERDTLIGPNVQIPSGPQTHGIASLSIPIRDQPGIAKRVTIGEDCWIGGQSVILSDIGNQTVVGAGSVVVKKLPSRVIAVGNPATILRSRLENEKFGEAALVLKEVEKAEQN